MGIFLVGGEDHRGDHGLGS